MNDEKKLQKAMENFTKEVNKIFIGKTPKYTGAMDEIYNVDIYIFRHPGMGNSKQIIIGNKISIMMATTSYLETLLRQDVCTEKELKETVEMAIKAANGKL